MRILSIFHLASELAAKRRKTVTNYMIEDRDHFKNVLSHRRLYVFDEDVGTKEVFAISFTALSANHMFTKSDPSKTVAQYYIEMGCPIKHLDLPCVEIHYGTIGYDYFPLEAIFYSVV